jgi:hypothetical protein
MMPKLQMESRSACSKSALSVVYTSELTGAVSGGSKKPGGLLLGGLVGE